MSDFSYIDENYRQLVKSVILNAISAPQMSSVEYAVVDKSGESQKCRATYGSISSNDSRVVRIIGKVEYI